ncbi:MAG: glycosyltransferase family 4 protein [Ferruginibacter sp.]|nr:glycosyltransferase family 4 protein [Ferruginibacter sp.]
MKKRVLHIIFNLNRGGAETMMVSVINELNEYEHVILTLFSGNDFDDELEGCKLICMNIKLRQLLLFPLLAIRMRKIINKINPDLIHTHLIWPTIIARIARPRSIPLVTTIHTFPSQQVDYQHWYFRWLDKITYRLHPSVIIAVAKGALQEYFTVLNVNPGKNYLLYTFVDINKFKPNNKRQHNDNVLKLVSVGALRYQKNHDFLIRVFERLKNMPISIDIYGKGPLEDELRKAIEKSRVNIRLMGQKKNIRDLLSDYDIFIMPSHYEGFSLAVLEAMAMKIPLLLSDIPSFHEQCEDTALYFPTNDTKPLTQLLLEIANDKSRLNKLSEDAYVRVLKYFTLEHHLEGLRKIYSTEIKK